jgi:hypothetical protein
MDLADRIGICGDHRGCVQSFWLTTTASQLLSGITLAFGQHEDRSPTHGYADSREAAK